MLNSPFLTSFSRKYTNIAEKVEMLSCAKFHLLPATLEVFFDMRASNRVPKKLNETMFIMQSMAIFLAFVDPYRWLH